MANGIDIDVGQSLLVGPQGPQGEIGPRGYGIKTIAKTGTDGLVDTYTVTFDDDRTATFEVTNGRAISSIDLTSTVENVDTYTITYNDGTTSTFTVTNSNVSREEFEEALELTNSEMNTKEAEGEKVKLTGVATTNLDITVQGNTYQETTTGKNLLNGMIVRGGNGIVATLNGDGSISYNGIATATNSYLTDWINSNIPIGNYTFSINSPLIDYNARIQFTYEDNTTGSFNIPKNDTSILLSIEKNIAAFRLVIQNITVDTEYNNTLYFQLEQGTEATDYEKPTFGPSPSPDYPQEIQVVTGDNEVQIQGKNLFDIAKYDGLRLEASGTITTTKTVNATENTIFKGKPNTAYLISLWQSDYTLYKSSSIIPYINGVFLQTNTGYGAFRTDENGLCNIQIGSSTYNKIGTQHFYIMIEERASNSYFTENYSFMAQSYPLSLGTLELAGIGDYKDYIYKSGTDWFIRRAIGKVIFDGSESWEGQWSGAQWAYKAYINDILKSTSNDDLPYLYSNLFISNTQNLVYRHGPYGICRRTSNPQVIIRNDYTTSLADFKTWLSTHNTTVYYPKATPTEEQITDTTLIQQLEALSQATAKGNDFIVTTETENLKPILKVQYKESTRYKADDLENRVEKLEEQIKHAGHVYGIRRKRENNSSSEWERTDDAIGLVANATHDGTEVQNDFDNLSPWKDIISFNLDLETGHKKAYYGDPDFAFDGSNGDVYTHIPDIYYRVWHDDEYDYVQIADFAESEFEKCDKFDIQRYNAAVANNVLHSYSNLPAASYRTIASFRALAHEIGEEYCVLDWRYFVIQLLYLVEYADYNSQKTLGSGCTSMRYNVADVSLLAEANTHRFVVNANAGNAFVVGQTVCVGTEIAKYDIAESRKIISITDYDEGGITGKIITLDGAAFSTTITSVIWSSAQHSGQCDSLGMKSGCLASDNKHPVIYRGIENIFGNVAQFIDGINVQDHQAYICYDPTEYVSDKFEEPYDKLMYINGASNGYIKKIGYDINNPLIGLPIEVGGSDSTYIPDQYYQGTGNRIFRSGGSANDGKNSGIWCCQMNGTSNSSAWYIGARVIKYK